MAQAMPWLRYLRNSTYYHFFRKAPPVEELHQASSYWAASQLGVVHQNPTLRSVWLIRNCLDLQGRGKLLSLVRRLSTGAGGAGGWFGYELGRWMMPLHALPALDEAPHPPGCGLVEGLDVFGPQQQRVAAAPEKWLRLGKLRKEQVMGAEEMYQLQEMLPQRRLEDRQFGIFFFERLVAAMQSDPVRFKKTRLAGSLYFVSWELHACAIHLARSMAPLLSHRHII